MNEPPEEWTAAERAALERLRVGDPPADLEDAVVAALAARGQLGGPAAARPSPAQTPGVPARRAWAWGALALAAALAAFFAGVSISDRGAGRTPGGGAVPAATAARYLLLLYEDAAYRAPETPEEQAARVAEYGNWVTNLRERGVDIQGEELAPVGESAWLDGRERGGVPAAAGAAAGELGILSGYFLVAAADPDAAMAIARTTPHLRHGGTVVIRRIVEH